MSPVAAARGVDRAMEGIQAPAKELSDAEIYARHSADLTRFATFLVGPSDACDVVSAAVVRALSSSSWPSVRNRGAYLVRSVLNEARRQHRAGTRRRRRETRVAVRDRVDFPEVRPDVVNAVARLSPRQRAVVFLTYWQDLDPSSVAEYLDVSEGSVRRHLARARARLRSVLHE